MKKYKITIANTTNENFVGAYLKGSISEGEGVIFLNMEQVFGYSKAQEEVFIDQIHETLVHEFCHLTQDLLNKELSELETDDMLKKINPSWGERDEDPVTSIYDFLDWLHKQGDEVKKTDLIGLFRAVEDGYNERRKRDCV